MIDIALYVLLGIAISCGVQVAVGKHKAKRERFERIKIGRASCRERVFV